jgi:hypothetical protein
MGMTDSQFKAFMRSLKRQVTAIQKAVGQRDEKEADAKIAELLEDIEKNIED